MLDISFAEILIVAIIALIVIGPERLPKVARTLGYLFGRVQRYVTDVKSDIQHEMELEELKKLKASMQEAAHFFENTVRQEVNQLQQITETKSPTATVSIPSPEIVAGTAPLPESPATQTRLMPQAEAELDDAARKPRHDISNEGGK